VAARRLLDRLEAEPSLAMGFLPINPVLPGPLRYLQRIKYVRTVVTSIAYVASLLFRVPRYDVLHVFSASYWSFLLAPAPAILIGRLFGKRVVLNYHSGEAEDHLTRFRTAIPLLRLADVLVVPSEYLVDVFRKFDLQSHAIYNFVDADRIPFRIRERPRAMLLSNRNFEAHYNVSGVLEAFRRVQSAHPEARLTIAGDGSERIMLRERASSLELQNFEFTGPVAPERMPQLYDEADIFLNASLIDNMPLSILEAYAAGLPVVTSDAGGIPYIVEHGVTGLVVAGADPDGLARGVERLIGEPGLAPRLTSNARRLIDERYSWKAVGAGWVRCYHGGR